MSAVILMFPVFQSDTKAYEKNLKLNLTAVSVGSLSDRGVKLSISNRSAKVGFDVSVLDNQKPNDCPLYVTFTGFMDDGTGKFVQLPCRYKEAKPQDFKIGTKAQSIKAGATNDLFSMIFPPKKWFVVERIGSLKLVAHYTYKKRETTETQSEDELKIPSFTLHSDTIIINVLK